ncbi:MAG TPA: PilZ domain-containing protein [Sphingomicrobium sp.]|nr:PilZ domain-containing protein [Sphingomicrobium sp.]HET7316406.1 PilZ domain-containing protein [Sphingomicrobium sp.]
MREQSALHASQQAIAPVPRQRRRFPRYDVQCRARIVIGNRHYAGYLHNISEGGARLRTITPIRKLGSVLLRLPDLPPLRCRLRWTDSYNAGVAFELALARAELLRWTRGRSAQGARNDCHIAELETAW